MEIDYYNLAIILLGIAILGVTWLPNLLADKPLSYPIIYVILGFLLYRLPLGLPDPLRHLNSPFVVHLTEFCVIVSLTGVGLQIDRPLKWRGWKRLFQLLLVAMILCIGLFVPLSFWFGGFSLAGAVLLAAVLSPTDPVLAADVQVGPPDEEEEKRDKFLLTAEAGFNDGLAFPVVYLAVALAAAANGNDQKMLDDWLWYHFFYKIGVGLLGGWLLGRLFRRIFIWFQQLNLTNVSDGFVSLALTLLVYGVIEIAGGYGFLSVFVAALFFSEKKTIHDTKSGKRVEFRKELHNFTDQLERLLIVAILLLFGAVLSAGLFNYLSFKGVVLGFIFVFVIRPLAGWIGLYGSALSHRQKWLVSFFGIRGIGSLYYLSYGLSIGNFADDNPYEIWAVAAFTVLLSIIVHGVLAYPATQWALKEEVSAKTS